MFDLKKAFPKTWLYNLGFSPSYFSFGSQWLWPTLWVPQVAFQSNPEGGISFGQPICSVSNDVEPIYRFLHLHLHFQTWLQPPGFIPNTVPSALNAFTHPLGTKRVIPIESKGGIPLEHPFFPESNDESCFILCIFTIIYKKGVSLIWLYHWHLLNFFGLLMTLAKHLGTQRGILIESRGGTSVGHSICPESNDVEPIFILHILQCSSKK